MEFRKMVTMTPYVRQQKRHRCIEQSFGLCGRGWGRDDLGEWHWNMYIIICEMDRQSTFHAWDRVLGACALRWPRGVGWGGRWERGSGLGTHVHPWCNNSLLFKKIRKNIKIKYASYEIQLSSGILHFSLDCLIYVKSKLEWMAKTDAVDEERADIF